MNKMRDLEWSVPVGERKVHWRPAELADVPAAVDILRKAWRPHSRRIDSTLLEADFLRWSEDWTSRLGDNGGEAAYQLGVLALGDDVCGFIDWTLTDDCVHAYNAAVEDSAFDSFGGGGLILTVLAQIAQETSRDHISLCTNVAMKANVRLFEWVGFAEIDRYDENGIPRISMKATISQLGWINGESSWSVPEPILTR